MSIKKRLERNAELKKKIAIEAIKERKTINEIAKLFEVHPRLVSRWKKEFLDNAKNIFENKNNTKKIIQDHLQKEAILHEKIGQLTIELDWLKKKLDLNNRQKRNLIEPENKKITISKQCELINLNRSSYYLKSGSESYENLNIMKLIDEEYTKHPFCGSRKMRIELQKKGFIVNRKKIQRLTRIMGIEAIYPKPKLSKGNQHKIYPYLLRNVLINFPNQVWSSDITYIRMPNGYLYLVAVIDWFSRYVLSWELSNSLEETFCLEALEDALRKGMPEIFNTDQGVQFTSKNFTNKLEKYNIKISMDGKGRALDNIFIERLWRSVKYEEIYLNDYENVSQVYSGLEKYFKYYNENRPHQSLGYITPYEMYYKKNENNSYGNI